MSSLKQDILKHLSKDCSMYDPCPICFNCMAKASHLYLRCQGCPVEFCAHNNKQREFMIRRENFAIKVTNETGEEFAKTAETARCQCQSRHDQEAEGINI